MGLRPTLVLICMCSTLLRAQTPEQAPEQIQQQSAPTITTRSTLVLIPALVKTKGGELVYTLTAKDFLLTDDGIEQQLTLEPDNGGQPLALVVAIETGSDGARQLDKYGSLATMIDNLVGNVTHKIAVVSFDGSPTLRQDFTPDIGAVSNAIQDLRPGDREDAILDALAFSVDLLRKQPLQYRRAVLLISETIDHGSQTTLDDALRAVSDTNTAIYAAAFSSSRGMSKREASQMFSSNKPGPAHGCMSRDPNDPNVPDEGRFEQTWDCLSLLAPPLRLAKIAYLLAMNGFAHNVPETVAHLTGGEYYTFSNTKNLEQDLVTISNHVPNRYVLSFHPQSPHTGLHALDLGLRNYTDLKVLARGSYWVDSETAGTSAK